MRFQNASHDVVLISEPDAKKVLEQIRPRWKLPAQILYHYGLRASEVMSLTSEHFRDGIFTMQRFKKGKLTRQAIHPDIKNELAVRIASQAPGTRLFPYTRVSLYNQIQWAGFRAGVERVYLHPHAFRHAAGRRWATKGTINEVMAMFGHKTLKMALLYSELACSEELSQKFLS
jgi:integrase